MMGQHYISSVHFQAQCEERSDQGVVKESEAAPEKASSALYHHSDQYIKNDIGHSSLYYRLITPVFFHVHHFIVAG